MVKSRGQRGRVGQAGAERERMERGRMGRKEEEGQLEMNDPTPKRGQASTMYSQAEFKLLIVRHTVTVSCSGYEHVYC